MPPDPLNVSACFGRPGGQGGTLGPRFPLRILVCMAVTVIEQPPLTLHRTIGPYRRADYAVLPEVVQKVRVSIREDHPASKAAMAEAWLTR